MYGRVGLIWVITFIVFVAAAVTIGAVTSAFFGLTAGAFVAVVWALCLYVFLLGSQV